MNDWNNKEWHKAVRTKLLEQRTFFRAQLHPYDMVGTRRQLLEFRQANRLDGLEAHLIFGSYDFLFVAWMHPLAARELPLLLAGVLQTSQVPNEFVAEKDVLQSAEHALTPKQQRLLDSVLNVHTIRAVQREGSQHKLFRDLRDNGLILDKETFPKETIRFFSTITMHGARKAAIDGIQHEINNHLAERPTILGAYLYRGNGFCHLLLEARVHPAHYFTIGDLTKALIDMSRKYEARVETYLPCETAPLLEGDPRIDDATFRAVKGTDPLVHGIIPEAYLVISQTADDIIQLLVQKASNAELTFKTKALLREVLRPVLSDDEANAATALFVCFTQIEAFLRKNQASFFISLKLQPREVHNRAGVKNPGERMTLGDLLQAYSSALTMVESDEKSLIGNWEPLIELRNSVQHGRYTTGHWRDAVEIILEYHCRIDKLIALICLNTQQEFIFTYFGQ